MDTGMLWYDDDKKRSLIEKVLRAVTFYTNKYGRPPTECYVHPSLIPGPGVIAGCRMHASHLIMVNHFWLGIEPAASETKASKTREQVA